MADCRRQVKVCKPVAVRRRSALKSDARIQWNRKSSKKLFPSEQQVRRRKSEVGGGVAIGRSAAKFSRSFFRFFSEIPIVTAMQRTTKSRGHWQVKLKDFQLFGSETEACEMQNQLQWLTVCVNIRIYKNTYFLTLYWVSSTDVVAKQWTRTKGCQS